MTTKIFKPGIYLRGIHINDSFEHVKICGGVYFVPFSSVLIHVKRMVQIGRLEIDVNVQWIRFVQVSKWSWQLHKFNARDIAVKLTGNFRGQG